VWEGVRRDDAREPAMMASVRELRSRFCEDCARDGFLACGLLGIGEEEDGLAVDCIRIGGRGELDSGDVGADTNSSFVDEVSPVNVRSASVILG
jgi:hypothetical protein